MDKCYLEITNVCNLACSFCHGTSRSPRSLTADEFDVLTNRLKGRITHLYFHLMGEPLLHPLLPAFIRSAREKGFKPVLTTNGTLLREAGPLVAEAAPYKVSVSLQAYEGNGGNAGDLSAYLSPVVSFAKDASSRGTIVVFRLWNVGGRETENGAILAYLHEAYPGEWHGTRTGSGLAPKTFLEWGDAFEWPDENAPENPDEELFCYGLRNQIGVLSDGTVVPCCLDADGEMALGNLFESSLEDILNGPRAKAIYDGFTNHIPVESLCRRCGYASLTKKYHGNRLSPNAAKR